LSFIPSFKILILHVAMLVREPIILTANQMCSYLFKHSDYMCEDYAAVGG
jgi:hypothetical protein